MAAPPDYVAAALLALAALAGAGMAWGYVRDRRLLAAGAGLTVLVPVWAVGTVGLHPMVAMPSWPVLAATAVLAALLIALSLVDAVTLTLPDPPNVALTVTGLAQAALMHDALVEHAVAALVGGVGILVFNRLMRLRGGGDSVGTGDAILLAGSGAWLGLEALPAVILIASAVGLLLYGAAAVTGGGISRPIAFAPGLCLGTWLVWLYGWERLF